MPHFKVFSINVTPVFEMRQAEDGSYFGTGGADFGLLQILSQKLPFSYELITKKGLVHGTLNEKGEWTGITKLLIEKEADLAVCWMANTYGRSQVVDFSFPYLQDTDIFVTLAPRILEREFVFLDPFQLLVWILLILSIVFSGLALSLLRAKTIKFGAKKSYFPRSWLSEMDKLVALFLSQGSYTRYLTMRSRAFMYLWTASKLVLVFCYMSTLLSFLMVPLKEMPLDDVQQLRDAVVQGKYQVVTFKGTSQLGNMMAAESGMVRDLADHLRRHPENLMSQYWELYQRLEGQGVAAVVFRLYFVFYSGRKGLHRYHMSKESLGFSPVSLAFPKGFEHMEKVNIIIHRITQSGLYMKQVNDLIFRSSLKAPPPLPGQQRRPLVLSDFKRATQILLVGHAIAAVCLVVEVVCGRRNSQKIP